MAPASAMGSTRYADGLSFTASVTYGQLLGDKPFDCK